MMKKMTLCLAMFAILLSIALEPVDAGLFRRRCRAVSRCCQSVWFGIPDYDCDQLLVLRKDETVSNFEVMCPYLPNYEYYPGASDVSRAAAEKDADENCAAEHDTCERVPGSECEPPAVWMRRPLDDAPTPPSDCVYRVKIQAKGADCTYKTINSFPRPSRAAAIQDAVNWGKLIMCSHGTKAICYRVLACTVDCEKGK